MVIADNDLIIAIQKLLNEKDVKICEEETERIASNSRKAVIKPDGKGARQLFIKLCDQSSLSGQLNDVLKIFDREIFFYSKIMPMLVEFQNENQEETNLQLDLNSMIFKYFGSTNIDDKGCAILLESFSPDSYFVTSTEQFFTLQQIHKCMEKIALLHGTSYAMSIKDNVDFKNYDPLLSDVVFSPTGKQISEGYFSKLVENNLKILTAIKEEARKRNPLLQNCILSFHSMSDSFLQCMKRLLPDLSKIMTKTLECPKELLVITHGDFHMWNIAFPSQGEMDTLKFFDFQMVRAAPAMIDIHHLLSQVCTPSTRNKHLHQFLETYYQSFKRVCLNLGIEEDKIIYTREMINKEYALRSPWGFIFGFCFILPRFLSKALLSPDFYASLNELDDSAAIVDLLAEKGSPNIWSALEMYADMAQLEDDFGTLQQMENFAQSP